MGNLDIVESGFELVLYPNVVQRIYLTNRKPYFFIELFVYLDIQELPEHLQDWMIPINDWLTLSLIRKSKK